MPKYKVLYTYMNKKLKCREIPIRFIRIISGNKTGRKYVAMCNKIETGDEYTEQQIRRKDNYKCLEKQLCRNVINEAQTDEKM